MQPLLPRNKITWKTINPMSPLTLPFEAVLINYSATIKAENDKKPLIVGFKYAINLYYRKDANGFLSDPSDTERSGDTHVTRPTGDIWLKDLAHYPGKKQETNPEFWGYERQCQQCKGVACF